MTPTTPLKLAMIGSRSITDYEVVVRAMKTFVAKWGLPEEIISGGAGGIDTLAERWCREVLLREPTVIRPVWRSGRGFNIQAGKERNREIIDAATRVLAFWDGLSNGTANGVTWAVYLGRPAEVVLVKKERGPV
jgi:hypothetical protein